MQSRPPGVRQNVPKDFRKFSLVLILMALSPGFAVAQTLFHDVPKPRPFD